MNEIAPFQTFEILDQSGASDRKHLFFAKLSGLTHPTKELPAVIDDYLTHLPGGENWKLGKR